jgi:hypothetical protein
MTRINTSFSLLFTVHYSLFTDMHFNAIEILPAIILFLLFIYWIYDAKLFSKLGFDAKTVAIIFAVKTTWCILFALLHFQSSGNDTLTFFQTGGQVHRALYRDPRDYFALVFLPCKWFLTEGTYHYYHSVRTYGNESSYFLTRVNAIFSLVSFGSYAAHLVLFSFVTLPAWVYLLRFAHAVAPAYKNLSNLMLLAYPGVAFWCNGMHKEAVALCGIGFILYASLNDERNISKRLGIIIFGLFLIAVVRIYLLPFTILVFAAAYYGLREKKVWLRLVITSLVMVALSFLFAYLSQLNPIDMILKKQSDFYSVNQMVDQSFLFTFFNSISAALLIPLRAFQNFNFQNAIALILNVLVFVFIITTTKHFYWQRFRHLGFYLVLIAIAQFIFIGFIVPEALAISRYKSPMLAVLIIGWIFCLNSRQIIKTKM